MTYPDDGRAHGLELKKARRLASLIATTGEWVERAACREIDADLFFPERGEDQAQAKAVCRSCPVQFQCLQYALKANEGFGVWGGKSRRERERIMGRGRA